MHHSAVERRPRVQMQSRVKILWGSELQDMCCVCVPAKVIFIKSKNKSSTVQLKCL